MVQMSITQSLEKGLFLGDPVCKILRFREMKMWYMFLVPVNIFCIRVPGCILCNKITFWEKSSKLV